MALRLDFLYLTLRIYFILLVSELKGVLYCNSANTSFVVKSMSRQGMSASFQ